MALYRVFTVGTNSALQHKKVVTSERDMWSEIALQSVAESPVVVLADPRSIFVQYEIKFWNIEMYSNTVSNVFWRCYVFIFNNILLKPQAWFVKKLITYLYSMYGNLKLG